MANPADRFIILKTTWSATPFQLDIMVLNADSPSFDAVDEFTGTLSMDRIEAVASELDASVDDLLSQTRAALSTDNGSADFSYELDSGRFLWYKNGVLKMLYGTVELTPTRNTGVDMLLTSLQLKSDYKLSYERAHDDLEAGRQIHERIKEEYDRFVAKQVELEEQTLTKFLALLNEKKEKISQLENLLSRVQGASDEPMEIIDDQNSNQSETQSDEPKTSGVEQKAPKGLKKRSDKMKKHMELLAGGSKSGSVATAGSVQKPTESNNNLSQDPIYSKDTEEIFYGN